MPIKPVIHSKSPTIANKNKIEKQKIEDGRLIKKESAGLIKNDQSGGVKRYN